MLGLGFRPWPRGGASAPWSPGDEASIIEWGDPDTMLNSGASVASVGQAVETWNSKGSVGTLTMTRSAETHLVRAEGSGQYLEVTSPPRGTGASGTAAFSFTSKELIGTELWTVVRPRAQSVQFFGLVGSNQQIGTFPAGGDVSPQTRVRLAGSPAIYDGYINQTMPIIRTDQFSVVRGQFRSDGVLVEVYDGTGVSSLDYTEPQASLEIDAIGALPELSDYDIAAYLVLFGEAAPALEANINSYLGGIRDALNGA